MDDKFQQFRKTYPTFIFDSLEIAKPNDSSESLKITYHFVIPGLTEFHPTLEIPLKNIRRDYDEDFLEAIAFSLGMVEAISYYKATCSPIFLIKAGYLTSEQLNFFQKLYFYGLGEFLYVNNIETSEADLVHFAVEHEPTKTIIPEIHPSGNLITVGGGKDSCVSLELLRNFRDIPETEATFQDASVSTKAASATQPTETPANTCFALNPKQANLACIEASGYPAIYAKRTIDPELLRLNREGFLNGHTPFSAMLAFTTYLIAYLANKKYIIMSNEGSANEATVHGTKINHQYSKTYEFENDFNSYVSKYLSPEIHYFSLLRPLTEFQIGMIFALNENLKKYHKIFKSCNVGSKDSTWNWCGECPKCLFVYIILSAFLNTDELLDIFGRDLYENQNLLPAFIELLGYADRKPFECVGTYEECRLAVSLAIQKAEENAQQSETAENPLPYLLQYYKDHYPLTFTLSCGYAENTPNRENTASDLSGSEIITAYNSENNLPPAFAQIIKQALAKYKSIDIPTKGNLK